LRMSRLPDCSAWESTVASPVGSLTNRPTHHDLLAHHAHPSKRNRQPPQPLRSARGIGMRTRDLGHRPQTVQDPAREPHARANSSSM
jgi:hypothetical protein